MDAGVDDVFVFINTFRQSGSIVSLRDRMWHTLTSAGKATFFTSLTTASAFAANIFSSVIILHLTFSVGDDDADRRQTKDASERNNTGPLGGPVMSK